MDLRTAPSCGSHPRSFDDDCVLRIDWDVLLVARSSYVPPWRLEVGEHLGRELALARRVVVLRDVAGLVDHGGDPRRRLGGGIGSGPIRHGHRIVRVAEKRVIEPELRGEGSIGRLVVIAASKDAAALGSEVSEQALEGLALCGSSAGRCARVEPKAELLVGVVTEGDGGARVRDARELGGGRAHSQARHRGGHTALLRRTKDSEHPSRGPWVKVTTHLDRRSQV